MWLADMQTFKSKEEKFTFCRYKGISLDKVNKANRSYVDWAIKSGAISGKIPPPEYKTTWFSAYDGDHEYDVRNTELGDFYD